MIEVSLALFVVLCIFAGIGMLISIMFLIAIFCSLAVNSRIDDSEGNRQ